MLRPRRPHYLSKERGFGLIISTMHLPELLVDEDARYGGTALPSVGKCLHSAPPYSASPHLSIHGGAVMEPIQQCANTF